MHDGVLIAPFFVTSWYAGTSAHTALCQRLFDALPQLVAAVRRLVT
jgi:hypothetical protein